MECTPTAANPMIRWRTADDLPSPGSPMKNADGLAIKCARLNQEIGSKHTVLPVKRCRPNGTPTIGVPDPMENGHNPHTCIEVPRHSWGTGIVRMPPPPRCCHPIDGTAPRLGFHASLITRPA